MSKNYLERLPLELITMIFDNLGHDLVAHVTFSELRPDIYDFCYKGRGRKFWKPILRASGLSTLEHSKHDTESTELTSHEWEKLARECVKHAEVCTHPECGFVLLRENEKSMQRCLDFGFPLMGTYDTEDEDDEVEEKNFDFNNAIWGSVTFKKRDYLKYMYSQPETWRSAAFMRHDWDEDYYTLQFGDELVNHPILWRSFVTFPPMTQFTVFSVGASPYIEPLNGNGVIVADVFQNILELDKDEHSQTSYFVYLMGIMADEEACQIIPREWSLRDTLKALRGFRDWLILVRCLGVWSFDVYPDAICASLRFWPQNLPDSYEDYVRLTTYLPQ